MIVTAQEKLSNLIRRYPSIFLNRPMVKEDFVKVFDCIKDNYSDQLVVQYSEEVIQYVFLSLVILSKVKGNVIVDSAFRLVDIYLGHDEDFQSISDFSGNNICLYLGYSEMENKRQEDFINQLAEYQIMQNRKFWLLYRGKGIETKYKEIARVFKDKIVTVNLTGIKSSVSSKSKKTDELF